MFGIEGVLAQTHTPEESIVCEKILFAPHAHTISKSRQRNNPQMGDFSNKSILLAERVDQIDHQTSDQVMQPAHSTARLHDAVHENDDATGMGQLKWRNTVACISPYFSAQRQCR
jgi:hypothetical protein